MSHCCTNEGGPPRRLTLIHVSGAEQQLPPGLEPLGPGEIALSRTNVRELATELGGTLAADNGPPLRVTQVFDDVTTTPVPEYWCGWDEFFLPDRRRRPSAAVGDRRARRPSRATAGSTIDEYRVEREPLTLTEARETEAAFAAANDAWADRYSNVRQPTAE